MSTNTNGIPPEILADAQTILDQFARGDPVDLEVARRVREQSQKAAQATQRRLGVLNVAVDLIHEVRNDE